MFEVIVSTSSGNIVQRKQAEQGSIGIGRGNQDIVISGWSVARHHANLVAESDGIYLIDLGSTKGTLVNGERTKRYGPLYQADTIEIGGMFINVVPKTLANTKTSPGDRTVESVAPVLNLSATQQVASQPVDIIEVPVQLDTDRVHREQIHKELLKLIDLRRIDVTKMSDDEMAAMVQRLLDEVFEANSAFKNINRKRVGKQVLDEVVGLGAIQDLLADDSISEVMVNSPDEIFYEKNGKLLKSVVTYTDANAVMSTIERIVAPLGRRIDESSPMVDARLKDGSRVNAIIPPLALKGPCITIRKFMKNRLAAQDLVRFGSMSPAMSEFLEIAVKEHMNVVISGGTGSGKTTLLNVLSNFIPDDERIVTIEDAAELKLYQPNLVSLEARASNQEGRGAITIRELVRNSLRMRPDRIVVGECRGGEALDMLQAMNTGHDGSLTTLHANSPRDSIGRMEVLVMMAGMDLPITAIREQIASAVNLIVQQTRFPCGSRRVTSITEVTGVESGRIQLAEIFRFNRKGYIDGKTQGEFVATGQVPEFYEALRERGVALDMDIFNSL